MSEDTAEFLFGMFLVALGFLFTIAMGLGVIWMAREVFRV